MTSTQPDQPKVIAKAAAEPSGFARWIQDPMGQIIASSVAVIGSFGLVLSGSWVIHVALH